MLYLNSQSRALSVLGRGVVLRGNPSEATGAMNEPWSSLNGMSSRFVPVWFPTHVGKSRGNSDSLKQTLYRKRSRQLMPTSSFCLEIPGRRRKSKCLTFTWHSTLGPELRSPLPAGTITPTRLLCQSSHRQDPQCLEFPQSSHSSVSPLFPCRIPVVCEAADSPGISQKLAWAAPSLLSHKLGWQSFLGASSTALSHRLMISCRSLYFLVVNHSPLKSLWRKHYISSHRLWTPGLALSFAARALSAQKEFVLQPSGKPWVNTNDWNLTAKGRFQVLSS